MIKIENSSFRNLAQICKLHVDENLIFIERKMKKSILNSSTPYRIKCFFNRMLNNDSKELIDVLKCDVEGFKSLHLKYSRNYLTEKSITIILNVFSYDNFSTRDKGAFSLIKRLNIPVCPYCNKQFISYIENPRKRPPLDHFFPRSIYPLFSLSFYNLIPSCTFCNTSFKGPHDPLINQIIYPYQEGFGEHAKFRYSALVFNFSDTKIQLNTNDSDINKRIKESMKLFHIDKVYESHASVAKEIYSKYQMISNSHVNMLSNLLGSVNLNSSNQEEIYQFYFSNYKNESNFEKRPLAKFTKDLVDDLGILNKSPSIKVN